MPHYPTSRSSASFFAILGKLNIGKEALIASQIGKVVLFYTKSIQPQQEIKRQAERLLGEWMRVVLKKEKSMRNLTFESKIYDPSVPTQVNRTIDRAKLAAEKRRKALAIPVPGNRARVEGGVGTYTVAPVNNMAGIGAGQGRKGGEEAFRKIAARSAAKAAGR